MTMTALRPVRALGRRLRTRVQARTVVLLYHRIAEAEQDPQRLCVSPAHFDEHMQIIRQTFAPTRVEALARSVRAAEVPRRAVAVTFDDGYADNLLFGEPILARHDVPATVYVATGQVGQSSEFWWDDLERLLLTSRGCTEQLRLTIKGCSHTFDLHGHAPIGAEEKDAGQCWDVTSVQTPSGRHATYRQLQALLKPLDGRGRVAVLSKLAAALGQPAEGRDSHRAMTAEQLRQLTRSGLVSVGAHTITHAQLSSRPYHEQRWEIRRSRQQLQDMLARPVTSFSYPFGGRADFTDATVELVRSAGYTEAFANVPGAVTAATDVYRLPRMIVRDWDGDEFHRHLRAVFHAA